MGPFCTGFFGTDVDPFEGAPWEGLYCGAEFTLRVDLPADAALALLTLGFVEEEDPVGILLDFDFVGLEGADSGGSSSIFDMFMVDKSDSKCSSSSSEWLSFGF
jgi:hypothetical protein